MSFAEFEEAMNADNYVEASNLGEGCYINNSGPAGSPYYLICKQPGEASFIWSSDPCRIAGTLKDELEKYFVTSSGKFSVYRFSYEGRDYTVKLQTEDGGGSVMISK